VTGVLSAPAKDAAAGVLAVLTQKGKDAKTFTLTSDVADVAAKIKDLASKGATVTVNGEMNKEGTSIVVTKIEASKKAEKPAAK